MGPVPSKAGHTTWPPALLWGCCHRAAPPGCSGCRQGPPVPSCSPWAHINCSQPPFSPLLLVRLGFCSLCPSLSVPQYLLLNIYNTPELLSSTQLPARESLAARARRALGQRGQSWGWEKMASARVALLCHAPASLLQCSCGQQACGHASSTTRLEDSAASLSSLERCWLNIYVRWCFWSGLLSEHHSIHCPS